MLIWMMLINLLFTYMLPVCEASAAMRNSSYHSKIMLIGDTYTNVQKEV